jgi:hypothetical protein
MTTGMTGADGERAVPRRRYFGRLTVLATVLAAAGTATMLGTSPAAHAATTTNVQAPADIGVYTLTSQVDGDAAGTANGATSWLTPVETEAPNNAEYQKFHLVQIDSSTMPQDIQVNVNGTTQNDYAYQIVSYQYAGEYGAAPVECFEAEGATQSAGDLIDVYGCNPNALNQSNQLWYPVTTSAGTELINGSSVAADGTSYSVSANGTITASSGSAPVLALTAMSNSSYTITGDQLELQQSNGSAWANNQQWEFKPTAYAVDVAEDLSKGASTTEAYGCFQGWAPELSGGAPVTPTTPGNSDSVIAASTTISNLPVGSLAEIAADDTQYSSTQLTEAGQVFWANGSGYGQGLIDLGLNEDAPEDGYGINMWWANYTSSSISFQMQYVCEPGSPDASPVPIN